MSNIDALSSDLKKIIVEYTKSYYVYGVYVIESKTLISHIFGNYDTLQKAVDAAICGIIGDVKKIELLKIPWIDDRKDEKYYKMIMRTEFNKNAPDSCKKYTKLPVDFDEQN